MKRNTISTSVTHLQTASLVHYSLMTIGDTQLDLNIDETYVTDEDDYKENYNFYFSISSSNSQFKFTYIL